MLDTETYFWIAQGWGLRWLETGRLALPRHRVVEIIDEVQLYRGVGG